MKNDWWGYVHIDGSIQVNRLHSYVDIEEAEQSDFVLQVVGPFEADNRNDAINKVVEAVSI